MTETLECGHKESPHSDITRGYGTDADGKRQCYQCCADLDRAYMIEHGRIALYLTDKAITNWPASLSFPVLSRTTGRHNIAGVRYDVWFRGPDGATWHGVQYGDNTQICHCKRTKQ